jgi:DNA-binding MarR family transcriptional regulator
MTSLKLEIAQEPPFSSVEEEALLNLMRTSDCMHRAFHLKTRKWGVTSTQYNVLRILRGAQPHGLTCSAIGDRMITAEPDITRILARLKGLKLIRQQRDKQDRRVIWTHISQSGLSLLREMDPVILEAPRELLGHLKVTELAELIRLLELARVPIDERRTPVSCTGKEGQDGVACAGGEANPSPVGAPPAPRPLPIE